MVFNRQKISDNLI